MSPEFENAASTHGSFRLGDRLVEPRLNRLVRDGESIQLEIKAMDVLVCLAERAGDVVTRQEIVDEVWATEFISDNTLTHAIAELRGALGDGSEEPSATTQGIPRSSRRYTGVDTGLSHRSRQRFPINQVFPRSRGSRFPRPASTTTVSPTPVSPPSPRMMPSFSSAASRRSPSSGARSPVGDCWR